MEIHFVTKNQGKAASLKRYLAPHGPEQWSVLWKVFVPEGMAKTIAEMSPLEREAWRKHEASNDPFVKEFPEWLLNHRGMSRA